MNSLKSLLLASALSVAVMHAQTPPSVSVTVTPVGATTPVPVAPPVLTSSVAPAASSAPAAPVTTAAPVPAVAGAPAAVSAGTDLQISDWGVIGDKAKAFGPKLDGGKVLFSGEGFGIKGKALAGYFPKTELKDGQTLRFSSDVQFSGVAGTGAFRFGIFQKRSRDHARGWLGYSAYSGYDKAFPKGSLLARLAGNDGNFDGLKDLKGVDAARVLGESPVLKNIKDGIYSVTIEVKKVGATMECKASMAPKDDPANPIATYAAVDASPATPTFDAIGIVTHEVLSTDQLELSNVTLKLIGP